MKLKIIEIFKSIQGEGQLMGQQAVFVRLSGCNLKCSHCDTNYSWVGGISIETKILLEKVKKYGCKNLVITGGEPLVQMNVLKEFLKLNHNSKDPMKVTLETNCTMYDLEVHTYTHLRSLSPKLKGMGQQVWFDEKIIQKYLSDRDGCTQLKFVIKDKKDLETVEDLLEELYNDKYLKLDHIIILQPNSCEVKVTDTEVDYETYFKKLKFLTEYVSDSKILKKFDVRVLPQLHMLIWKRKKGI